MSTRWGRRGPRYRRRRPLPALVLLVALVVLSGLLWSRVFERGNDIEAAIRCNAPSPSGPGQPAGAALGATLPWDSLNRTSPVPPQQVQVRVLNANGESRQASLVSDELSNLGFARGGASNDPAYPNYDLKCHGQIRFGQAGTGAARTLSLIVPCAELVRDGRADATVDLALGSRFEDVKPTSEAKRVLQALASWGSEHKDGKPPISDDLLTAARDVHC